MLRDKMTYFVKQAPCSVGILLSRAFDSPKQILLYVMTQEELRLLPYARTMAENNQAHLRILAPASITNESLRLHSEEERISDLSSSLPEGDDLVIVSYNHWLETFDKHEELIAQLPSTLILALK